MLIRSSRLCVARRRGTRHPRHYSHRAVRGYGNYSRVTVSMEYGRPPGLRRLSITTALSGYGNYWNCFNDLWLDHGSVSMGYGLDWLQYLSEIGKLLLFSELYRCNVALAAEVTELKNKSGKWVLIQTAARINCKFYVEFWKNCRCDHSANISHSRSPSE